MGKLYVIVFEYRGPRADRRFWTGDRWSSAHTSAKEYSWPEGRAAFVKLTTPASLNKNTFLVENYGRADERVAMQVELAVEPVEAAS